jgi:beta-lactam-binding protein with PASTA domain
MSEEKGTDTGSEGRWARLPGVVLMVLVLVVAGLLSALTAMRIVIRGREVEVPELAGMTEPEAAGILASHGLEMKLASRRFSPSVQKDRIMDQIPVPGTRLKAERSVKVLVSLGERRFSVPDVEGASLRATQLTLTERGLSVGNTLFAHTNGGEPSTVVYQSPEAGDIGASDPAVNVLVSLGPVDRYYVMPDLKGRPASEAIERVRSEGFRLGEITYTRDVGVRAGTVVQQRPRAGYKLSKTDIILLEVSQ